MTAKSAVPMTVSVELKRKYKLSYQNLSQNVHVLTIIAFPCNKQFYYTSVAQGSDFIRRFVISSSSPSP